ncbi:MAG: hypothetical protein QOE77_105 [Blastocatellia bacterium]|jgi:hypothetical protein|nr:hypothetical protein [Blastocatellia bacterium]
MVTIVEVAIKTRSLGPVKHSLVPMTFVASDCKAAQLLYDKVSQTSHCNGRNPIGGTNSYG